MNRLPELDQIVLESQRPLLAVLDTTLVLVVRSMRAEHPELEDDACRGLAPSPRPPSAPWPRPSCCSPTACAPCSTAMASSWTTSMETGTPPPTTTTPSDLI